MVDLRPWPEVQGFLPGLSSEEKEHLRRGVKNGVVNVPILYLPDGRIIDGHHRWELSDHTFPFLQEVDISEDQAFILAISLNIARRQMSKEQVKALQEKIRHDKEAQKKIAEGLRDAGKTQEETAAIIGVAQNTISMWESDKNVNRATNINSDNGSTVDNKSPDYRVTIPSSEYAAIYARWQAGEIEQEIANDYKVTRQTINKIIEKVKQGIARKERAQTVKDLPQKTYNVIYADPPWKYDNTGIHGAAEHHYAVMEIKDICDLLKKKKLRVDDNAVLFLWVTNPFLEDAFKVVKAWGFEYKTNIVWIKTDLKKPGSGFYVRGRHELLFICTRGSFTPLDKNISPPIGSVIEAPVREHSQKPEEVYAIIERLYPGCSYIELFGRQKHEGWDTWGDEAG